MRRGTRLGLLLLPVAVGLGCGGSPATRDGAVPCKGDVPAQPLTGTTCRFAVPTPATPACDGIAERARIGVLVDGTEIARDMTRMNGWDFTDATMETLEIYGPPCVAITAAPATSVTVVFKFLIP